MWKFGRVDSDFSTLLTEADIADISISTNIRDLHSIIVLRYRWSQITQTYQKIAVATHRHTLSGNGRVNRNTISVTDARPLSNIPLKSGDKIFIDGTDTERTVTNLRSGTPQGTVVISFDGAALPAANRKAFWAGPNLSLVCLTAHRTYGADSEIVVETRLIQDDASALYVLSRLIERHAKPKTHATITSTPKALTVREGETLAIAHPALPSTLRPAQSSLTSPIQYSVADPFSAVTGGMVLVNDEVMVANGVTGRGLLHTLRKSHATGDSVQSWASPPRWVVEEYSARGNGVSIKAILQ